MAAGSLEGEGNRPSVTSHLLAVGLAPTHNHPNNCLIAYDKRRGTGADLDLQARNSKERLILACVVVYTHTHVCIGVGYYDVQSHQNLMN